MSIIGAGEGIETDDLHEVEGHRLSEVLRQMGVGCFGAALGNRGKGQEMRWILGERVGRGGRTPARRVKWGVNFQKTEEGPVRRRWPQRVQRCSCAPRLAVGGLLGRSFCLMHVWLVARWCWAQGELVEEG